MPAPLTLRRLLLAALTSTCACTSYAASASGEAAGGPAAAADEPAKIEEISIIGTGQTHEVQALADLDIAQAAPGTSAIKVVEKLPGVNFQAADPFGAYEWAVRISVRGFNQNQMGFTLDGLPLGDMSYGNYNGLHISRAIISEDIGRTVLSQGTGALDTASTSNLGGTLQFFSLDPTDEAGLTVAQTLGSANDLRSFARLETGTLPTGAKAYVAFVHQDTDKWKGTGQQKYNQVNLKFVQPAGAGTQLTGFFDYSDRKEVDYQDLSKEYIAKLGYNWDNYYPDWSTAVAAARGVYTHGENTTSDPLDAAYYAGSGLRRDTLGGLTLNSSLNDALTLSVTPYGHHNVGVGQWYTPYTPSPNGTPISLRTTEYDITRYGVLGALTYQVGEHKLEGGFWYEHSDFDQARRFYSVGLTDPGITPYDYPSNPFFTQWQYSFVTRTVQPYLQDTWHVAHGVTVNLGAKSTDVSTSVTTEAGSPDLEGTIKSKKSLLPQAGLVWSVGSGHELFASVAQNMRAFTPAHTGVSPFATTQAGFDATKNTLNPESSWTYEAGYRLTGDAFETTAAVYHVNFKNRLLGITAGAGIQGNPTILANVGGVTTNGVDLTALWHVMHGVSWYNSVSYDKSTYDDNVTYTDGTFAATQGKQAVDTPKFMYKSEISYEHDGAFVNLSGNYMSERFYTYTNDNSAPAQFVADLGGGLNIERAGPFKTLKLQFNIYNLLDRKYISAIGTNGFVDSDPTGTFQTLQVGAPRQYFMTATIDW